MITMCKEKSKEVESEDRIEQSLVVFGTGTMYFTRRVTFCDASGNDLFPRQRYS
jgi:hypothetical protein